MSQLFGSLIPPVVYSSRRFDIFLIQKLSLSSMVLRFHPVEPLEWRIHLHSPYPRYRRNWEAAMTSSRAQAQTHTRHIPPHFGSSNSTFSASAGLSSLQGTSIRLPNPVASRDSRRC